MELPGRLAAQRYPFQLLPLHPQPAPLESFTSYITRLAQANGLKSLKEIAALTDAQNRWEHVRAFPDYPCPPYAGLARLAGCSETTLLATTFFFLGKHFGCPTHTTPFHRFFRGSLATHLRYCPRCLAEASSPSYSLTWRFTALSGCVKHACTLLDQCGHCGSPLPLMARAPRMACCPTCRGDVSTCSTAPLASAEAHTASRRTRELEMLLSPWTALKEVSLSALGKRFDLARQQRCLTIAELAQRMGGDGREVLAIEYGNGTREATFRDYMRYAEALGLSLQEVFEADRFPERLSHPSEEEVLDQVEAAIHRLQAQGEPVLPGRIGVLVGIRASHLKQYPRVRTVLQRSKLKRSRETVGLDHQREDELVKRVEQAIKQAEFLGKPVTQQRICHIVGMTYSWLIQYPRVKALLLQIAYTRPENVTRRMHREEQELMVQVEQAITQLESRNEPVTHGQICELLGISRERLHKHQRIKTRLRPYNGNSPERKQRVQQREEELVKQVEHAMAHLVSLGDSVTQWRVCKAIGLSQRQLERYPRVKALLDQCKGKRHRRRSRVEQHEKVLLKQMEQALQQLEAAGEPVLPRTVAMMIHLPLQRLDDYPHIKARFRQILDEYNRNQAWQWQQQEEEVVGRIHQAIQTLEAHGKAVTQHALLSLTQLTLAQANKYPRVRFLLEQVQTARRGALHE